MAQKKVKEESSLVWEEPPASRGGRGVSAYQKQIADELKARPGEWAKVATGKTNDGLASAIRRSTGAAFRDGLYEARSVKVGEKNFDVYARYVSPNES